MKMDMNAMCFIDQYGNIVTVSEVDDLLQIGTDAKVSRIDHEQSLGIGMHLQRFAHGARRDAVGDAEASDPSPDR